MKQIPECEIPFFSSSGPQLGSVRIIPAREATGDETAPLAMVEETEAREFGETVVQLREGERYEYEVKAEGGVDLRLRCGTLATRRRSLKKDAPDAGLIETRSYCGTLLLELVEGAVEESKPPVATALLDVRSMKTRYRTEYRGMLRRLADEIAGLVADARSAAKTPFRSSLMERTDEGWLQIQLELLREVLDSPAFSAVLQRIVGYPHERLSMVSEPVATDRPIRWTPGAVRQLVTRNPRRAVPDSHPLRTSVGLESIAERVMISRKSRNLDTPENRFVKFALGEFRAFLAHAQGVFERSAEWSASAALAGRLALFTEDWLSRGFFQEIGEMRIAPLGSPVLQRKAGYRELLRWWLRFRTAAELSWEGGEEVFRAGQRDVATLYEYWLFFELLGWFCRKCCGGKRPPVEELVEGLDEGTPNLRLRKSYELGPFAGSFAGKRRKLKARFSYNRRFEVTEGRQDGGSWTRRLHPDYTLTFWPEMFSEAEAERLELLVHVHLDAKYRVEDIEELFGGEEDHNVDAERDGNYKRQDLLKMHAYRDAIKRSQGAYVLYPGRSDRRVLFKQGFHEILPGLGAFGVAPNEDGAAQGMKDLEEFLDQVLGHLSNRTTAQERVSYHISEAYKVEEAPVEYGEIELPEADPFGPESRSLPPSEEIVLVCWYNNDAQLGLALREDGFVYVRLGRRQGALHVHPNIARARYVLLRTHGSAVAPGLLELREFGFRVYTRGELRDELNARAGAEGVGAWQASAKPGDEDHIYALFKTRPNGNFTDQSWDPEKVNEQIEHYETDSRNRLVTNLGRTSPYPRLLPLRSVLKARA